MMISRPANIVEKSEKFIPIRTKDAIVGASLDQQIPEVRKQFFALLEAPRRSNMEDSIIPLHIEIPKGSLCCSLYN